MPNTPAPKFDFLTDFVLAVLEENGIVLSDEQKKAYVPEFLTQVEQRLAAELLPKLNDEQLEKLNGMIEAEHTTPEAWEAFWKDALPSFETDVKDVLRDFAKEVSTILAA